MKSEMSSLDIAFSVREMNGLAGARVEKAFQEGGEIHLALHVPGKGTRTLVAGDGRFFLSERTPPHSIVPSNFAMYLRKHIGGKRIKSVEQAGFDRIVSVDFGESRLIFEIFREGNSLFVSQGGEILSVLRRAEWKGRTLERGAEYTPPPASIDLAKITEGELVASLGGPKQIVAHLAREMSLGGTYAEEVCLRAEVDKAKQASALSSEEKRQVYAAVKSLIDGVPEPAIITEGEKYLDVTPVTLKKYAGFSSKPFSSFNSALEDYFFHEAGSKKECAEQKEVGKKGAKLLLRKKEQEAAIQRLEEEAKTSIGSAEAIKAGYAEFEQILASASERGIKNAKSASEKIRDIDEKKKTIFVGAGKGAIVALTINKTLAENINWHYLEAKRAREKILRARVALEKTNTLILEGEAPKVVGVHKAEPLKRKKEWYHNFRWFISSSGLVVVGGRDAATNELVVKKHAEKGDLVFHTDVAGSPFVVVKSEGKGIDKKTIDEAAQFAACHSRAWKQGVGVLDVFYVSPGQVTKKTPSGEYMGHGSFMVYGEKNWAKTELRLAAAFYEGAFICGPVSTISGRTSKYVLFGPGTVPAKELAKRIKAEIFQASSKEEQEALRRAGTEELERSVPFGAGEIIKRR